MFRKDGPLTMCIVTNSDSTKRLDRYFTTNRGILQWYHRGIHYSIKSYSYGSNNFYSRYVAEILMPLDLCKLVYSPTNSFTIRTPLYDIVIFNINDFDTGYRIIQMDFRECWNKVYDNDNPIDDDEHKIYQAFNPTSKESPAQTWESAEEEVCKVIDIFHNICRQTPEGKLISDKYDNSDESPIIELTGDYDCLSIYHTHEQPFYFKNNPFNRIIDAFESYHCTTDANDRNNTSLMSSIVREALKTNGLSKKLLQTGERIIVSSEFSQCTQGTHNTTMIRNTIGEILMSERKAINNKKNAVQWHINSLRDAINQYTSTELNSELDSIENAFK